MTAIGYMIVRVSVKRDYGEMPGQREMRASVVDSYSTFVGRFTYCQRARVFLETRTSANYGAIVFLTHRPK